MPKAFFIDTSRCTACRGCQVACKEWHEHGVVPTLQRGTHQNPPELTPTNFKIVHFDEHKIDGRIHWLFFPEQCRHCVNPPCKDFGDMYVPGAVIQDEATGAVLYTEKSKELTPEQCKDIKELCPYLVPRRDEKTGMLTKCDMCIDRVQAGMQPACVKTCCTGAMNFGEREEMVALAHKSLEKVKKKHPQASLLDEDSVNVMYLVTQPRDKYFEHASRDIKPLSRQAFLQKIIEPVRRMAG
ncbi:MAG: 4Fe-4S dicluster domain-containing protein [Desulfovibrionaceae bacterium]|nr:4Fe-4S dicluster domain-containing protein [Desulfovibrionaceae bacterium]